MPGIFAASSPVARALASTCSNMPAPVHLPPPEPHEVLGCGIPVELALGTRSRNESRSPSLEVEDGLHIQQEAELFQFALDLGHGLAADRDLSTLDDLAGIDTRIDQLDGHSSGVLPVVHGPERGLLAPVLGHLAVVDPHRAQPRYLKQAGLEERTTVDQAEIGIQDPYPLPHR